MTARGHPTVLVGSSHPPPTANPNAASSCLRRLISFLFYPSRFLFRSQGICMYVCISKTRHTTAKARRTTPHHSAALVNVWAMLWPSGRVSAVRGQTGSCPLDHGLPLGGMPCINQSRVLGCYRVSPIDLLLRLLPFVTGPWVWPMAPNCTRCLGGYRSGLPVPGIKSYAKAMPPSQRFVHPSLFSVLFSPVLL
jgi:hypothetical protein